jgi:hypothetical protein
MPKRIQHERSEQEALITWARIVYPDELLFAIPNSLVRTCVQARNMARSGLRSGVPDLCLAVARKGYHGLYIELKRTPEKGQPKGQVTAKQREIIDHLNSRGYLAKICYGWDSARETISEYMES